MDRAPDFNHRSADNPMSSSLNITFEVISNLAFLAHEQADDSDAVRKYTELIQERILAFTRNLNSQN